MDHDIWHDTRVILTLDTGRTGLKFSAIAGGRLLAAPFVRPTYADDGGRCLAAIVGGFEELRQTLTQEAAAISFAFPGPADYPAGIIAGLENFPAFRDPVPLGPILEEHFGVPVFINNDGDLFVYGEAIGGFLPYVNGLLEAAGSPKRYRNLFGITIGTGLGAGIVVGGKLLQGDNSAGGEAWLLRHKHDPGLNAEEGASIRAVQRVYAECAGIGAADVPEPRIIAQIAEGIAPGNAAAAREAFRRLGEVAGDVCAQALTLIDGLVVVGGGIAAAHRLFFQALVRALNEPYGSVGIPLPRIPMHAFNIEDAGERRDFLTGRVATVRVPGTERRILFDGMRRTAAGLSRLGTSEAVSLGAYAFALQKLAGC
jgi:glucokinase